MKKILLFICLLAFPLLAQSALDGGLQTKNPFIPISGGQQLRENWSLFPFGNGLGNLGSTGTRWNFGYLDTTITNHISNTTWTLNSVSVTTTGTEFNYVAGVTSAVQTQVNAKAPTADPTFTGTVKRSVTATITASTTQSQGQGALTTDINEVSVVATINNVVTLPTAVAGMEIFIINNGANTLQIFPASGDNLGAGLNTSTTLASGSNVTYVSYNDTNWEVK